MPGAHVINIPCAFSPHYERETVCRWAFSLRPNNNNVLCFFRIYAKNIKYGNSLNTSLTPGKEPNIVIYGNAFLPHYMQDLKTFKMVRFWPTLYLYFIVHINRAPYYS